MYKDDPMDRYEYIPILLFGAALVATGFMLLLLIKSMVVGVLTGARAYEDARKAQIQECLAQGYSPQFCTEVSRDDWQAIKEFKVEWGD